MVRYDLLVEAEEKFSQARLSRIGTKLFSIANDFFSGHLDVRILWRNLLFLQSLVSDCSKTTFFLELALFK